MALDLETAKTMVAEYEKAEKAAIANRSYSVGDKKFEKQDLAEIRKGLAYYRKEVDILDPDTSTKRGPVFRKAVYRG